MLPPFKAQANALGALPLGAAPSRMAAPMLFDGNIAEGLPRDTRSYYPPSGTEFLGVGFRAVVEGGREKALMLDHSSDQAKPMARRAHACSVRSMLRWLPATACDASTSISLLHLPMPLT